MPLWNPTSGGSGTADPIALAGQAWIETAANGGDDTTGAVGTPAKPFATPQGALNALIAARPNNGDVVLNFGMGAHGALVLDPTIDIWQIGILGTGKPTCSLASITYHRPPEILMPGLLVIRDLGSKSVNLLVVDADGMPSTDMFDLNGGAGGVGSYIELHNVLAGDVHANGGAGANATAGTGGFGGSANSISLNGSETANASIAGGKGGNAGGGAFPGGPGGNAGQVYMQAVSAASVVIGSAGLGGTGSGGGAVGTPGLAGLVDVTQSSVSQIQFQGGPLGTVHLKLSSLINKTGVGTSTVRGSIFNNVWQDTGSLP